jgi:hypothetical protein
MCLKLSGPLSSAHVVPYYNCMYFTHDEMSVWFSFSPFLNQSITRQKDIEMNDDIWLENVAQRCHNIGVRCNNNLLNYSIDHRIKSLKSTTNKVNLAFFFFFFGDEMVRWLAFSVIKVKQKWTLHTTSQVLQYFGYVLSLKYFVRLELSTNLTWKIL